MGNQKLHIVIGMILAVWLCLLVAAVIVRDRNCNVNMSGNIPHLQRLANILFCLENIKGAVANGSDVIAEEI